MFQFQSVSVNGVLIWNSLTLKDSIVSRKKTKKKKNNNNKKKNT